MKKNLIVILFLFESQIYCRDLSQLTQVFESPNFIFFTEDNKDYSELYQLLEFKNNCFETLFNKHLDKKVKIFIFKNRVTFSKAVFDLNEPYLNISAFANHNLKEFYITSFYSDPDQTIKYKKIPVHELVHLYLPGELVWLREGIACYLADMLDEIDITKLPKNLNEFGFYRDTESNLFLNWFEYMKAL